MLARLATSDRKPLWVACPDVVCDPAATWANYLIWSPVMRSLGLPVAFVLQNGVERMKWLYPLRAEWSNLAAVFVGGDTEWKLSRHARTICEEAKSNGKLVHVGRVNTEERIHQIARWKCVDTFDGSGFSKWGRIRIPRAVRWIDDALFDAARPRLTDHLED